MEQRIDLKKFEPKEGVKYKVIHITDVAFHSAQKVPTKDIAKQVQKSFRTGNPGRIYSMLPARNPGHKNLNTLELLKMDANFVKMVQEEEANGFKVLLSFPKDGIPIFAGSDTTQFIDSKNGGRLTRGLAKEEGTE